MIVAALCALYTLQSDMAETDGQTLILTNAVQMTHPLGQLKADYAVLEGLRPMTHVSLTGHVEIHSAQERRATTLSSDFAEGEIDAAALYAFQRISCTGHVHVATSDGFAADGGAAHYTAFGNQGGVIELFPAPIEANCSLSRGESHIDAQKMRFDIATSHVLCEKPRGQIATEGMQPAQFRANRLTWSGSEVKLDQDVFFTSKIQEQESFALADQLIYNPESETFLFTCQSPRRVLFWQASGDLKISAPEVRVKLDSETNREIVEGVGDVHFVFDLDEKQQIEKVFSKLL